MVPKEEATKRQCKIAEQIQLLLNDDREARILIFIGVNGFVNVLVRFLELAVCECVMRRLRELVLWLFSNKWCSYVVGLLNGFSSLVTPCRKAHHIKLKEKRWKWWWCICGMTQSSTTNNEQERIGYTQPKQLPKWFWHESYLLEVYSCRAQSIISINCWKLNKAKRNEALWFS